MSSEVGLARVAEFFKVLGHASRLRLLRLIGEAPRTVGALSEVTGMSQPLVSQHLRTLRQADLVTATRHGKEMTYQISDEHVTHVIEDAFVHVLEPHLRTSDVRRSDVNEFSARRAEANPRKETG